MTEKKELLSVKEQMSLFGLPINVNDNIVNKTRKLWLSNDVTTNNNSDYGTFKDSLRAPVHRWFKYPAGYSYRLVEEKIKHYQLNNEHFVLDPFVGSGTTSVECKRHGINSFGIEAHPFVGWIAKRKVDWDISLDLLSENYNIIIENMYRISEDEVAIDVPDLVHKCYSDKNLKILIALRNSIKSLTAPTNVIDFFNLALIDTLRNASKAATGWPYIGPTKHHEKSIEKDAFKEFGNQVRKMYDDLEFMQRYFNNHVQCTIILGDARSRHNEIIEESIDLALTSPPYLNNYDYADRTRLETYFLGWYNSWGQITEQVREKLIISATTQIRRSDFTENYGLDESLKEADSKLYNLLIEKIKLLSSHRLNKSGKKSYDYLVAGYFTDMFEVLKQVYYVLKPGADFVLVLGDSAPYGVYIPTHEYLAQFGLAIGFSNKKIEELRIRGGKWKNNPQRHNVMLKEVILTLTK